MLLGIGLTGCDWFNESVLGKQNKADLEALEQEKRQSELDSIKRVETAKLEALLAKEKEQLQSNPSKGPFHIIVGAFEEKENVDNTVSLFKTHGYSVSVFNLGGLTHVSAISFETLREAETALKNMLKLDYCPEDAWVLKR